MVTSTPVISARAQCRESITLSKWLRIPGSPHPISDLAEAIRCAHRPDVRWHPEMTLVDYEASVPSNRRSRPAWNEIHRELLGQVKLRSCHFARDGFAQPQHVF